ncbi:MAG: GTPase [Petroclostridium sp.]|jgi:GTP-binding protein Era|uniref:GTPase Era n=1 Tax=Petroclostridium xylanilyticum TaxID=1792311 RepID=UPI000B992AFB|nr:GTPase Era [Petroclostridium xylanilyticum]MBZ4644813.1 era 1 [Clostridia bacterium]MDK2811050.1 GTPase [Petroclostridium sp.]
MVQEFKSGFIAIIGRPNVGKSTLLNSMVGEKIAIMSDKPQTTRNKILAILTEDNYQMIFMDTPGIHTPKNKLGEYMVKVAEQTLKEVDVVLFVVEADKPPRQGELEIIQELKKINTPVILIINKVDLVKKDSILLLINEYSNLFNFHSIIPVSALNSDGIHIIKGEIRKVLPVGPKFFPEDMVTDQPERQIVSEIIREKILHLLEKEVPHGIAVEVISIKNKENKNIIEIMANIYCEKDSHKGIIIGKNGEMLKKIGSLARMDIENLFGSKVFLELWVKVKDDWRNKEFYIKNFGYQ